MRIVRQEEGASAVEFALILAPIVIILIVIMQFGLLLFVQNDMFNAAREAARRWASNDAATLTMVGGTTTCGTQVNDTVEDAACETLTLWSSMTFRVTPSVSEPGGALACGPSAASLRDRALLVSL